MAIAVIGSTSDQLATVSGSAASYNYFENCIFECELAIQMSDYIDERNEESTKGNGNLSDGCQQDVVGNVFWHCNFIGDPNPVNKPRSMEYVNQNRFFEGSREARDNWIISCIVKDFDRFSEGTSGVNAGDTPYAMAGTSAFTFKNCCLKNTFTFWIEYASGGNGQAFQSSDLGDGNITSTPTFGALYVPQSSTSPQVNAGFDGDWNNDGSVTSHDEDAAIAAGLPVFTNLHIHAYPTGADFNQLGVRTDGSPDIGAQEYE